MDGKEEYKKWHWGNEATDVFEIKYPSVVTDHHDQERWDKMNLVECGRQYEIHFSPFGSNPKKRDEIIRLPKSMANKSHLAFDADHPYQRLYFILCLPAQEKIKSEYGKIQNPEEEMMPLGDLAMFAGGKHATDDYENIMVKPLGIITNVVYSTDKKGDGFSHYIHKMGEETGIKPALGVAKDGSLWFAGGDYTCPIQGITN